MANKITKKEMFTMIMNEVKDNEEMVAFLKHEIELLDNKAKTASNKNAEKASANAVLAEKVIEVMTEIGKGATATEIANASVEFKSNQQVSYLLRTLIADGRVSKTVEKGKSIFSLV